MTAARAGATVIVGATSCIAEHCARLWAERGGRDFVLVGRDAGRTGRVAEDLRVRVPEAVVDVIALDDFNSPAAVAHLVGQVTARGPIARVLIAHGTLPAQAECQDRLELAAQTLQVNGVSPALFAEAFAGALLRAGGGTIAVIGSVAGDRGRKSNYVYGAAKGLVTRYVQGLQHRLHGTPVRVVLVKPGPTETPMTQGVAVKGGPLAAPQDVAARIVAGMDAGRLVVYAPARWAWIMLVFRHLPWRVFRRMDV